MWSSRGDDYPIKSKGGKFSLLNDSESHGRDTRCAASPVQCRLRHSCATTTAVTEASNSAAPPIKTKVANRTLMTTLAIVFF
jgi:hypothetical protein